jgi:hypothetical protein
VFTCSVRVDKYWAVGENSQCIGYLNALCCWAYITSHNYCRDNESQIMIRVLVKLHLQEIRWCVVCICRLGATDIGCKPNYWLIYLFVQQRFLNYGEKSPSWETNRPSASQEIPRILWNPKVQYSVHTSPQPTHQDRTTQSTPSQLISVRCSIHAKVLKSGFFSSTN